MKHHVKIISKQEFWDALPDVMYHMDEPLGCLCSCTLFSFQRGRQGHVKGSPFREGADELSVDIIFTENRKP